MDLATAWMINYEKQMKYIKELEDEIKRLNHLNNSLITELTIIKGKIDENTN